MRPFLFRQRPHSSVQNMLRKTSRENERLLNLPLVYLIILEKPKTMLPIFSEKNPVVKNSLKLHFVVTHLPLAYPPFLPACFIVEITSCHGRTNANFNQMITFSMFHSKIADEIRANSQLSTLYCCTNPGGNSIIANFALQTFSLFQNTKTIHNSKGSPYKYFEN